MVTVYNRKTYKGHLGVYVGRTTPLGNPFHITPERDREATIECYREWLIAELSKDESIALQMFSNLVDICRDEGGIDLLCSCKPKTCHADVIKELLDEYLEYGKGR